MYSKLSLFSRQRRADERDAGESSDLKERCGWKVVWAQSQRQKGAQSRRYGQVNQSLEKQEVNSRGLLFFEPSNPEGSLLLVSSSKLSRRKL